LIETPVAEGTARDSTTSPAKVAAIIERLRGEYGVNLRRAARNPTDALIATILSQHTADRNSSIAYRRLEERYPIWENVAQADVGELAETIRAAGLANIKARRIQAALLALQERHCTMDLSFLAHLPLAEARETLRSLPGVGPKTAACVLLFACNLPALPVDTHVHRLARRLGLIGQKVSAERAHEALEALVAPHDVYDFHINLIRHGRTVCRSREPRCGACVVQEYCHYFTQEEKGGAP
jgi:endonuclease-3